MYMVKRYMPREPNLNFKFIYPGEGLEMLARVGLCEAVLDFRGESISLRACEGLWAGLLSSIELTVIS